MKACFSQPLRARPVSGPLALLFLILLSLCGGAAQAQAQAAAAAAAETQPADASGADISGVDINTADAAQLAAVLVGVGQGKAESIVRYREQFGPFESVEELAEVKGIGAATVERNRSRIRLR